MILANLGDLYGSAWRYVHGNSENEALRRFLNSLDSERSRRVFEYCREQISKGNKFAPNLGELIVFSDTPTDTEYFLILTRIQSNDPKDIIEQYLCENIRYNLKRQPADQEIKYLKNQYMRAAALKQAGKLKTNLETFMALPKCSSVNVNDVYREDYAQSGKKHRFSDRIANLINS